MRRQTARVVRRVASTGAALAVAVTAVIAVGPADARGSASIRLTIPASARQLIVVSSPTPAPAAPGYLAQLRTYMRAGPKARWRPVFRAWSAETGFGHLVLAAHRREGDGSTPIGVFGIGLTMYGNDQRPRGLHYRYHRLVCGDWWDEDPFSPRYNRFVHVTCGQTPGFAAGSEALWTETVAYPYFAALDFNSNPTISGAAAPGSGIFLHSWVGGPTAGCVALPQGDLLEVLRWLRPSDHPVMAIGTDRELGRDIPH